MTKLTLALAALVAISGSAWADSTASAPSSGSSSTSSFGSLMDTVKKNASASYQFVIGGPSIRSLSGNSAGAGTNLNLVHYISAGYKIGSKWRVSLTQPFSQFIDEKPSATQDPFVINDPYITFTNPKIWASEKYGANLYGYVRYYAPFSRPTSVNVAKASPADAGNGSLRMLLIPSKTFLDGALTVEFDTLFQYRFAARSSQERASLNGGDPTRQDFRMILDPIISYQINPTYAVYGEYFQDNWHSTNGHWGKLKDNDTVYVGSYIQATKRLWVNPYIGSAPRRSEFRNAEIGFQAVYSLL